MQQHVGVRCLPSAYTKPTTSVLRRSENRYGHLPRRASKVASLSKELVQLVSDQDKIRMCQIAPSTRIGISEGFGLPPGTITARQLSTSLRRVGFEYVFDTLFAADVTILEEGTELLQRLQSGELKDRPMFTSCCPGWIAMCEKNFPEVLPYVSTTKSPQMIMGAIIKRIFAASVGLQPEEISSVSIMPCTRKSGEAARPHYEYENAKDVDLVITVNELVELFKEKGVNPADELETDFDAPFSEGSGSSVLFGRSGGVMTAALRFAFEVLTGTPLGPLVMTPMEGFKDISEASVTFTPREDNPVGLPAKEMTLKVAVVLGLGSAKKYVNAVIDGKTDHQFVEVMACLPAGCIGGAGLARATKETIEERKQALNAIDTNSDRKAANNNRDAQRLYDDFIGEPGNDTAHHLFHNHGSQEDSH